MNNNNTTTTPSAPADKSAQVERISVSLEDARRAVSYKTQVETAAVMLGDILNTIEANEFQFVSLRWIHRQGKAALAVLETGAR